jgi:hypothetical protein
MHTVHMTVHSTPVVLPRRQGIAPIVPSLQQVVNLVHVPHTVCVGGSNRPPLLRQLRVAPVHLLHEVKREDGTALPVRVLMQAVDEELGVPEVPALPHMAVYSQIARIVVDDDRRGGRPTGPQHLKHTPG